MVSVFQRSSLLFLAGVVIFAVGGSILLSFSENREQPSIAESPAESSSAHEPRSAPIQEPAGPSLAYDLEAVAAGAQVPRVFATALPESLKANHLDIGREEMLRAMLPLALLANEQILADRRQLWEVRFNLKRGFPVPPEQRLWIEVLADRYGTSSDDLDELASRVDVVPPSIVLALVGEALERKRREALERERKKAAHGANAGLSGGTAGSLPWSKRISKEAAAPAMPDVEEAPFEYVRAIMRALNTAKVYESFRAERVRLRQAGEPLDGLHLAGVLPQLGSGAIRTANLGASINAYGLTCFDKARLQPSSPSG